MYDLHKGIPEPRYLLALLDPSDENAWVDVGADVVEEHVDKIRPEEGENKIGLNRYYYTTVKNHACASSFLRGPSTDQGRRVLCKTLWP